MPLTRGLGLFNKGGSDRTSELPKHLFTMGGCTSLIQGAKLYIYVYARV